jgi:hypothetical protein
MSSIKAPPKPQDLFKILKGKKIEEIEDRGLLVDFKGNVMYYRTLFTLHGRDEMAEYYSQLHSKVCDRIRVLIANEEKTA